MHIPRPYRLDDRAAIDRVIREHGFATLVTTGDAGPDASLLPFLLDAESGPQGTLIGHMGRANPQWQTLAGAPTLVIFNGPHGYVTPRWYVDPGRYVPTWNYVAVHVRGVPELIGEGEDTFAVLEATTAHFESFQDHPWQLDESIDYARRIAPGTVAFRIPIDSIEASFKLSQDKPAEVRERVIAELERAGQHAVAEAMREVPRERG